MDGWLADMKAGGARRVDAINRINADKEVAAYLGDGDVGLERWETTVALLREQCGEDAVSAFQKHCLPLVDQKALQRKVMDAFKTELPKYVEERTAEVEKKQRLVEAIERGEAATRRPSTQADWERTERRHKMFVAGVVALLVGVGVIIGLLVKR